MVKLREIQLEMLNILKYIDKICKENKIQYWLDAGTLLGAVRHGGFIPWDDDLDIGMLEEDYQKFINVFNKYSNNNYFLVSKEKNKNYNKEFIKIMSKEYILIENKKQTWPKYVYVDIFPFRKSKNKKIYKKIALYQTLKKNGLLCLKKGENIKNIFRIIRYFFIKILPLEKIIDYIQKRDETSNNLYIGYNLKTGFSYKIEYEYVFPLKNINFENNQFPAPNNLDKYLQKGYGNYMELPPENKRKQHAIEIKKGKKNESINLS